MKKYTIRDMQNLAKKRGGKCLSSKYYNIDTKLKWVCEKGHTWNAIPYTIKKGTWCPNCVGKNKTISDMQNLAKKRGGKCLSSKYYNNRTKLEWECKKGHIWESASTNIQGGTWCPICAGNTKLTIEYIQELARKRGGECLSTKYYNNRTKLKWRCGDGHEWSAVPDSIKRGQWCSRCTGYIGEELTRNIFEGIFEEKFPKKKPKWLINKEGNRMELDGYNETLKIAFEYHGSQHYKIHKFFHQGRTLKEQIKADKDKKRQCEKKGKINRNSL